MKVLICAYRDWAIEIFNNVSKEMSQHHFDLVSHEDELTTSLGVTDYELIFFVGWSWIVDEQIINSRICICLHPSPLPKYRGGSPIQNQIINGETVSAVSLFKMDNEIDHGPIMYQQEFSLNGSLKEIFTEITKVGTDGIIRLINEFPDTLLINQNDSEATMFKRRTPRMSEITIEEIQTSTALQLHNKVRCLQEPYPLPYIVCADGKKLFLLETGLDD